MSKVQKGILILLGVLLVAITAGAGFALYAANEAKGAVDKMYKPVAGTRHADEKQIDTSTADPFSILLLGIDSGGLGRTDQGRSDTTMVVTINPKEKKTTIASIDRDYLIKIVGNNTHDKLNSAYSYGGVEMTIDTLENFLDLPINHYATINMQGLEDLIDAVGGIEVDNKIDFTLDGIHVPAGKITLDGKKGLAYARMRKDDGTGDIGRQGRQREVLTQVVKKMISVDTVTYYKKILKTLGNNVTTDLTWDQMMDMATKYTPALDTINSLQLAGQGMMIGDGYYQIPAYYNTLNTINELRGQLDLAPRTTLSLVDDYEQRLYDDSYIAPDAGWDDEQRIANVQFAPYFANYTANDGTATSNSETSETTSDSGY